MYFAVLTSIRHGNTPQAEVMKMPQTMLNVRIDTDDKRRFVEFCSSVDMDVSVAVVMFVNAVLRESSLPFKLYDLMLRRFRTVTRTGSQCQHYTSVRFGSCRLCADKS